MTNKALADVFAEAVATLTQHRTQLREYEAKYREMRRTCKPDCDHPEESANCEYWMAETRRRVSDTEQALIGQVGVASAKGLISDTAAETLRQFFTPRAA
jgi:hypothetical protein